jgi:hypothetical protein
MFSNTKRYAAVLPHKGKYIAWCQSPNGTFMLLSGHWITMAGARAYCDSAGYTALDSDTALAQIERQMEVRLVAGLGEPQPDVQTIVRVGLRPQ